MDDKIRARQISRRDFIKIGATGLAASVLVGCASQATEAPPAAATEAPGGYSGIHQATVLGDRIYLAYGMDSSGVIQILDRDKFLHGDPNVPDPFAPTPHNLLYPEIARIDLPTYWGGHTVYPMLDMPIADYAPDGDASSRDILAVVSEVTAHECRSARHVVLFFDMTQEEDNEICELQHVGLSSPFSVPGRYAAKEALVHKTVNWILDRVLDPA